MQIPVASGAIKKRCVACALLQAQLSHTVQPLMGAWGYGIRQDDFVLDVVGDLEGFLKAGLNVPEATTAVLSKHAATIDDPEDGPLLWIAIADVQWIHGALDPQVFARVKDDVDHGRGLDRWRDDSHGLARRRAALGAFVGKIAAPNSRPRKLPKAVVRAPKFKAGDCLSIHVADGQYAAALVLAAEHSNAEYGTNLIGILDYLSTEKPSIDVYRERRWLVLNGSAEKDKVDVAWYHYLGFRSVKGRLEIVGHVDILDSDPKDSNIFRRWTGIGDQALSQRVLDDA